MLPLSRPVYSGILPDVRKGRFMHSNLAVLDEELKSSLAQSHKLCLNVCIPHNRRY